MHSEVFEAKGAWYVQYMFLRPRSKVKHWSQDIHVRDKADGHFCKTRKLWHTSRRYCSMLIRWTGAGFLANDILFEPRLRPKW